MDKIAKYVLIALVCLLILPSVVLLDEVEEKC